MPDDSLDGYEKIKSAWKPASAATGLGEWDAGDDDADIPPRGWLLGNVFCRRFVSSLVADGGVGKTALRVAQLIALASGRPLTGEHVFQRGRVLIVSLEDDADELRRRVRAAMLHHSVTREEVKGWLFLASPGAGGGKLAVDENGRQVPAALATKLRDTIIRRRIDVVSLDPFVKAHAAEENSNNAIDGILQILSDAAAELDCAIDVPHHASKGPADPGNANRGRGASAMKDGARLVYTLSPMSLDEAQALGVTETDRRRLIRMDGGKVNIAPPMADARWFRLVGVPLGNGSDLYPHGDEVQTVEPWTPPDTWAGLSHFMLNEILNNIEAGLPDGNRYTDARKATDRAAWKVVVNHAPEKNEAAAKQVIKTWLQNGVLIRQDYHNPITRKMVSGLRVDDTKRPS